MKKADLNKLLGKKISKNFKRNWEEYNQKLNDNDEIRIEWEKLSGIKLKNIKTFDDYIEQIDEDKVLIFAFDFQHTIEGLNYWSNIEHQIYSAS